MKIFKKFSKYFQNIFNIQVKELQWKFEAELNELQAKNAKLTQQLENRVASLDVQNRDLWEVRVGHEASLRE